MDTITVGTDIKLVGKVDNSTSIGSTATILYVDDFKKSVYRVEERKDRFIFR